MLTRNSNRTGRFVIQLAFALLVAALITLPTVGQALAAKSEAVGTAATRTVVYHKTTKIDGLDIFYREAGPKDAPTVLLLHGFPTSSHMFRNLIPALADRYHVVAPDYPGYGNSSAPSVKDFKYTFDNLANVVEKFTEKIGLKNLEFHLLDTGHFALEEDGDVIAQHIRKFLGKNVDAATHQCSSK
jgi:predicted alpha/beta-fold hydrolase